MNDLEKAAAELGEAIANFVRQAVMTQPAAEPESVRLYSVEDLTKLLGKSKDTVRRWVANGEFGEPVHVGKSLRITQAALDRYLEDHSGPVQRREIKMRGNKAACAATRDLQGLKI